MKKIIVLITLFMTTTYNSQSLKDFDLNTKTLNVTILNENNGVYDYDLPGGIHVHQKEWSDNIREEITRKSDPYSIERTYYLDGKLHYGGSRMFYYFDIGIDKFYDEQGKIIKENNYDYGYSFSTEDLIKKMKQEYGIDLSVYFFVEGGTPHYVYRNYIKPGEKARAYYQVNVDGYNKIEKISSEEELKYQITRDTLYRDGGRIEQTRYYIDGKTGETIKTVEKVFMRSVPWEADETTYPIRITPASTITRMYEIDAKGELLEIREYRNFIFPHDEAFDKEKYKVEEREDEEKVIYQKPGYKEGAYKTYKGKDYTREEWAKLEKLEKLELESYAKKRNFKLSEEPKSTGKFFLEERDL